MTQGGFSPALLAFKGEAIFLALFNASLKVDVILFLPITMKTLSGPYVIAATLFPLWAIFAILPSIETAKADYAGQSILPILTTFFQID